MAVIQPIRAEFMNYKSMAEKAMAQLGPEQLNAPAPGGGNSIAVICWHISGNLRSRFTEFLTSDGEKPWRQRDEEFEDRVVTREALLEKWEAGWRVLIETLDTLSDEQLNEAITIRGKRHTIIEALIRALAHVASHVGQIVYAAKMLRGDRWTTLSIPKGQSQQYTATLQQEGERRR